MRCPKCHTDNKEGTKFCVECGHKFEFQCPQCGRSVMSSAKFCDECGHRLTRAGAVPPSAYGAPESYTPKYLAEKIFTSRSALEGKKEGRSVAGQRKPA